MSENTSIKTMRTVYPQVYAFVTSGYERNEGWVKIGYTERRNVDERIRQQTGTALRPARSSTTLHATMSMAAFPA